MILLSLIRVIGILLAVIASTMVIPICAAWVYGEFAVMPAFVIPAVVCIVCEIFIFFVFKNRPLKFSFRSGFAVVALSWLAASLLGAVPFLLSKTIPSFADAFFATYFYADLLDADGRIFAGGGVFASA